MSDQEEICPSRYLYAKMFRIKCFSMKFGKRSMFAAICFEKSQKTRDVGGLSVLQSTDKFIGGFVGS